MNIESNLKVLCSRAGVDYDQLLSDLGVESALELNLFDIQTISEEYEVDMQTLLFHSIGLNQHLKGKLKNIKLLILDVDGVMTDGGMYFTENGDQIKKYNTKDGLALMKSIKDGLQVAIISSGFAPAMVQKRADMLGIQHCIVTREPKIDVLRQLLIDLKLDFDQVAMLGDDLNDLEVMKQIGIAACPKDAVKEIKSISHIHLSKKGGEGCVREFLDDYLNNLQQI